MRGATKRDKGDKAEGLLAVPVDWLRFVQGLLKARTRCVCVCACVCDAKHRWLRVANEAAEEQSRGESMRYVRVAEESEAQ